MMKIFRTVGLFLLIAFVACSDDDNGTTPNGSNNGNGDPPVNEVGMSPTSFLPSQLSITAGETVTWNNTDSMLHTVTSEDGLFDANVQPGASFSYTFESAGTYAYECTLHPGMVGTINVE